MAEFRYKAFISYSHQDEAWAKWLHGALESYRIPRRLVGKPGRSGAIPARINPVFRDRDDLSAARDLNNRITEALDQSESLIVICSPDAACSHWVNEEIRKFRINPQGERIFCLIVDGDPRREPADKCCFPPVLFEPLEQQNFEPLAAVQLQSGMGVDEASLAHLQQAIDLIEKVMLLVPDKTIYESHYATMLAWSADAQYQACNLENAMVLRQKVSQLAENLVRSDPGDNDLKRCYAYAISGVSAIQSNTGQTELAEQNLRLAISILEQLSAADHSNILYPQQIAYRQFRLAKLMAVSGHLQESVALMSGLESKIGIDSVTAEQNEETRQASMDFHLAFARINYQSGNKGGVNLQLKIAFQLLMDGSGPGAKSHSERERLQEMRFQWWEVNGEEGLAEFPMKPAPGPVNQEGLISCEDALNTAKEFVIKGELDQAISPVRYLQERGYADPALIQFCTKYGLCSGTPGAS